MWCIQEIDTEYRNRMYDILDLYEEPYDPKKPVVAVDEKPKQLLGEKRKPISIKPGKPERYDYGYIRNGNANIFMATEFKAGKRFVKVTDRRTKQDFATFMRELVNQYPNASKIQIVLDNLNTHFKTAFYETFPKKEAKQILQKIKFHYTPKHASWLNAAEIEIGAMDTECTARRIPNKETLTRELQTWMNNRNQQQKKINWRFTKKDADKKLSKQYVQ